VENTIQNITEFIKQSNIDIFVKNNQNNHKKFEDLKNFNHEKFQEINNPNGNGNGLLFHMTQPISRSI